MPLARYFPRIIGLTRALPAWIRLSAGIATSLGFFTLRETVLAPYLPPGQPFLLLVAAVLTSASVLGRGAGYAATATGTALVAWFLPPFGSFAIATPEQATATCLFAAIASVMTGTFGALHDTVDALAASKHNHTLLLSELRHRTRNDLAAFVGLLTLRAARARHPEAQREIRAAAHQAMAVARLHARISNSHPNDIAVVDTQAMLEGLAADVIHANRPQTELFAWAERHHIGSERAVTMGLLLTEAVTNACRHAFPGDQHALISVTFVRNGQHFDLQIEDNGIGCDPEQTPGGIGRRMLRTLAKQLRGHYTESRATPGPGTVCRLRFPADPLGQHIT